MPDNDEDGDGGVREVQPSVEVEVQEYIDELAVQHAEHQPTELTLYRLRQFLPADEYAALMENLGLSAP